MGESVLSEFQKMGLQKLLDGYGDVVTIALGKVSSTHHTINTGDSPPIRSHPYGIAPGWREELKEEVLRLVRQGILVPSQSPWSAPMVPVRKPSGAIRLCIDYRRLNQATLPDSYQMQRVEELLDDVAEAAWLSKLDMNQGFYQVPLQADSGPKRAFCSTWGKFCFTRMPFGLMTAPAIFQRCMNEALTVQSENMGKSIDDVLVYSWKWEAHLHHIEETLKALRRAGLTAKPDKCVWGARSLSYLGHDVGEGLVRVPDARVRALRDFARPRTQKDLRAFLGTAGYYQRFIPDFAGRAGPLFNALKKGGSHLPGVG